MSWITPTAVLIIYLLWLWWVWPKAWFWWQIMIISNFTFAIGILYGMAIVTAWPILGGF